MSGIFISYRRDDSGPMARRLYELLCARFGPASVFIDVDTIEAGSDFAEVIDAKVGFCDGFVAVIGKTWATIVDAAGRRRLDDPAAWVRLEIVAAQARSPQAGSPLAGAAISLLHGGARRDLAHPGGGASGSAILAARLSVSYVASNYVDWLVAAVLLHVGMRLAGGTATAQASVAAACFLSAFLPVIGLFLIPVWGLNIAVTQGTAALNWSPVQAVDQIQAFTASLGVFGTIRVMLSFVAATALWRVLLVAMAKALRTLHRLGRASTLAAFAGAWLAYLLFVVFFYAPLAGMVYQAFGLPPPR